LLVWTIRRARAPIAFGLLWFAVALLPTSLFPLAEVANEHRVFFAFIGLVLALAAWLPPRVLAQVMLALILINAIGAHVRNKTWKSADTLWADVVAKSPGNGRAWMNYGLTKMAKGDYAEAKELFEHAATFVPNYSNLEINRAIVDGQLGDQAAAERRFRRALELQSDAFGHFFYARWLVGQGRVSEAREHLRESLRMSPGYADTLALSARLDAAQRRDWPDYTSAFNAGLVAIQQGDWTLAVDANLAATRHDPKSADAFNNLGWALAQMGKREDAAKAYRQSLQLRPSDERTMNNLRQVER
jgi:tetratricopeptide (TPR) repeat protein